MLDASAVTTEKIYYEDAYAAEFGARVISLEGNALVLDRTAFFPEEGGQSCDLGEVEGVRILDVQILDERIVHFTENVPDLESIFTPGRTVHGKIDWERRYDLMQQHSGEHLLSGYVNRKYGFRNVGFHLTPQEVTLDFDGRIPEEDVAAVEAEVNRIIRTNIESETVFVQGSASSGSEAGQFGGLSDYRSKLDLDGEIRVVVFPGADACACCAPHVRKTGEIGSLKIVSMINWKGGVRLTMACGARATALFAREHELLTGTSRFLTTSTEEVLPQVMKMKEQLREMAAKVKEQETALILNELEAYEANNSCVVFGAAETCCAVAGGEETRCAVIVKDEADPDAVLKAADAFARKTGCNAAVFTGTGEEKTFLIAGPQAQELLAEMKVHFQVKGGGRGEMVRGRVNMSQRHP